MMPILAPRFLRALRFTLTGGISLTTLAIITGSVIYPSIFALDGAAVYLGLFVLSAVCYLIFVWVFTRRAPFADGLALRHGLLWGGLLSGLWLIEIMSGNFGDPSLLLIKFLYFGATLAAFILPLFAGLLGGLQTGRSRTGTLIGLWGGLLNGTCACLALVGLGLFFNGKFQHDPQTLREFAHSGAPNLPTYVFGDFLAGGINHLWLVGPALGSLFGTLGGLVGAPLAKQRSPSTRRAA
ncbi:MAG: hypothetical protein H0U76_17650 [Ktedonobacteraceae bacterium]|nr:hypothetical protein [Ktedonobacteraceae bacterium]MBA3823899.1 hypothetical protein [Ktedonobacterales bacterium]